MIIVVLLVVGLCLGSFVNALIWRIHEQEELEATKPKKHTSKDRNLSVLGGRSMCPTCRKQLRSRDLFPVVSWIALRGKCRDCSKPISWQYPLVELATAALFIKSYVFWPQPLHGLQIAAFGLWLLLLVGFMALTVYDLKWYLLPNRIVYPLSAVALLLAGLMIMDATNHVSALIGVVSGVIIGGGIFYVLFQLSRGTWIGGGDVKLGWLLGLALGSPAKAFCLYSWLLLEAV